MNRLTFAIEKNALRHADFLCSCSVYTARLTRQLFGLEGLDIRVLYNSVDVSQDRPVWMPSGKHVVYTGTLARKKGVIPLIQAWKQVHSQIPDAELHLYGKDGKANAGISMREFLLSHLSEPQRKSVFFHGHMPQRQVREGLRCASVAVFPSYAEAFALGPLEAMAQGCPTVYSRRSSGPELITHGEDGLLVDPDNVDEISISLVRLLTEPDLAARLSEAGWRRVRDFFSNSVVIKNNLNFYAECLARFSGRAVF